MLFLFAHGGETHEAAAESAWHSVISEWYIGIPIYLVVLFAIGAATYLLTKSKAATYNVLLIALFIAGVSLYSVSAPISVISLAAGFAMAMILVITSIGGGHSGSGSKK